MALQVYVKKLRELPQLRFEEEGRGYRKDQVDKVLAYLTPLADEIEALQEQLSAAETRAAAAESQTVELKAEADRAEARARTAEATLSTAATQPSTAPASTATTTGAQPAAGVQSAAAVTSSPAQAAPEPTEDYDETLRNTLLLAERTAEARIQEANSQADDLVNNARLEADELRAQTAVERERAEAAAIEERSRLMSEAHADVSARIDAAETELAEAEAAERDRLLAQIGSLTTRRDELADDIDAFEAFLSDRREKLRAALNELVEVVDDPVRLRSAMPPERTPQEPLPEDIDSQPAVRVGSLAGLAVEDGSASGPVAAVTSPADATAPSSAAPQHSASQHSASQHSAPDPTPSSVPTAAAHSTAAASHAATPTASPAEAGIAEELGYSEATQAVPTVAADVTSTTAADASGSSPASGGDVASDNASSVSRPAWADSIPSLEEDEVEDSGSSDPFLDELRRATADEGSDEDISTFLEDDDDKRSGWFGRRNK